MVGTINVYDAIHLKLPKTLETPEGATVALKWYLQGEPPSKGDEPGDTHGVYSILSAPPTTRDRQYHSNAEVLATQTDVIAFVDGTLTYEVSEQDIDSITSIDGFVGAAPHTFVEDTDFEFTSTSIVWLPGGTLPDDATNFTVEYEHKTYTTFYLTRSEVIFRAIIRTKDLTDGVTGRIYKKTMAAHLLGDALSNYIRRNAGSVLQKPVSGGAHTDYHLEAALGTVIASRPVFTDPSETLSAWSVDFKVKLAQISADDAIRAIKTVEFDVVEP